MKLPAHLVRNSFFSLVMAVVAYGLVGLWLGFDQIRQQLRSFPLILLLGMALLSLLNYGLRFWRWELYLRRTGCQLPLRASLGLYFTAYVMVITPGKIGEVFKAAIMKEKYGVPLAQGLPVVLAERIYDFLAVLALAGLGLLFWPASFAGLVPGLLAAASVPVFLILLNNDRARTLMLSKLAKAPIIRNQALALDESLAVLAGLFRGTLLPLSFLLSSIAWLAECMGLWLACRGIEMALPPMEAVFTYAAGTLVGSLSFLPGGLGGTEATIIYLLQSVGLAAAAAAAVALLVRLFTLWLAVVIGLVFFLGFRKEFFGPSSPE